MNLLLVSNLFPPEILGGYELLASDVATRLRSRGHRVEVLTTGTPHQEDPEWVHRCLDLVRPFGTEAGLERLRHLGLSFRHRATTRRVLAGRVGRVDAALVMSLRRLGPHVPRELARRGVPSVFCFNDDYLLAHRPGEGGTPLRRRAFGALERGPLGARTWRGMGVRRAIYISEALRATLRDAGAPVPEGTVCLQGVDTALFAQRPFRPVAPAPRLLFVGRLHPTKACDIAIRAVGELRRRGIAATLTVAGTGDEAERARLSREAAAGDVTRAVRFLGFVPREELPALYHAHDVFLFPSRWEEPAGLTQLEAMACGIPVVAMPTGGAAEMLADGENCLSVADAEQMASAVATLLDTPALAARLVAGGLHTVRQRASLERYVDTIEDQLHRAAEGRPPRR